MSSELARVVGNLVRTDAGRRFPVQVLGRFAYLQLRRRLSRRPFFFDTATGTRGFVEPRGDFAGITNLFYLQFPTLEEEVFACHCLRPGEVFWDVGANQGLWSLLLVGRGVEAHAFEPTPSTFAAQVLQFQAQQPQFRRLLHSHNVALGAEIRQMKFAADRGLGNSLLADGEDYPGQIITVDTTTVDAFVRSAPAPQLIKIDVEGWTSSVLQGATETLSRPDLLALVIETFRTHAENVSAVRDVEGMLARFGFRPVSYDPERRFLRPLTKELEGRDDTIYVRDPESIAARLISAPPVAWFGQRL